MSRLLALTFAVLAASVCVQAQSATAAAAAKPPAACTAQEFRQFDFWVGTWLVKGPAGREQGKSEITRVSDGCAVREQWSGAGGMSGMSINYYDQKAGRWKQDWVGGDGMILHLAGGMEGGSMVMGDEREAPEGRVTDRITWTPLADGKVKQEWSVSSDGGKSWKVVFQGFYERR